jgi:hypothetical protein
MKKKIYIILTAFRLAASLYGMDSSFDSVSSDEQQQDLSQFQTLLTGLSEFQKVIKQDQSHSWMNIAEINRENPHPAYTPENLKKIGLPIAEDENNFYLDIRGTIRSYAEGMLSLMATHLRANELEIRLEQRDGMAVDNAVISRRIPMHAQEYEPKPVSARFYQKMAHWWRNASGAARFGAISTSGFWLKGFQSFIPTLAQVSSRIPSFNQKMSTIVPSLFLKSGGTFIHKISLFAAFGGLLGMIVMHSYSSWFAKKVYQTKSSDETPNDLRMESLVNSDDVVD